MTHKKKRIQLTITALSPLAIGREKPGGSVSEVEKYIPGSVIRGAIAKEILSRYPGMEMQNLDVAAEDNHFQKLFLDENPAIFHNAYPAIAKVDDGYKKVENVPIKVLPATAVSSKANPGFITDKKHGVFDTLIDGFCADTFNHPYDPSSIKAIADGVDSRVEAFSCFYSEDKEYRSHSVTSRLLTRVGINRRRATAEEDILYSTEVLNEEFKTQNSTETNKWENYIYRSDVILSHAYLEGKLIKFITDNLYNFRLGSSASRGLGQVKIEAKKAEISNNIKSKINKFNNKLKERFQEWSNVFGKPQDDPFSDNCQYFTINLQSEAILLEDWQRTTVISTEMLKQFVGVQDDCLKLHCAYSSYDYRSGWNSAWGLMKDVELITNKGSVYLFSTKFIQENSELWYEALSNLELSGVGERTCEGFGQVEICNEFHLVFREEAV